MRWMVLAPAALGAMFLAACGDEGTTPAVDAAPQSPTFAPSESPFGKSMGQWAGAWWTWAFELPGPGHPIAGGPCTASQAGEVFFLAGNFGGVETRACTVPAGKALFFPVLNSVCYPQPETQACNTPQTPEDLAACAAGPFDSGTTVTLAVTLDGVAIATPASYRVGSGVFSWPAPSFAEDQWLAPNLGAIGANDCGLPTGDRFGVADGYWMMLRPLAPGPHTLRIEGAVSGFSIDVTYQLTQQ